MVFRNIKIILKDKIDLKYIYIYIDLKFFIFYYSRFNIDNLERIDY